MESKWKRLTLAVLGGILATGVTFGVVSTTFAQEQTQDNTAQPSLAQPGFRPGGRMGGMVGFGGFGLRGEALTTVAATLKISEADLQTALQSGKSVADIASEKSIALDTVISAIVAAQKTALTQAVTDERLTQAQADGILANLQENLPELLNVKPLPTSLGLNQRPEGGLRGLGGARGFSLATIAETLKLSEEDLRTELQSGKSVADIATEHKIALDTVVNALVAEQTTRLAQAVTDGKLTQAQADEQLAQFKTNLTTMLSQPFQPGGPGGRGERGPRAPQAPATPTEEPSDQSSNVPVVPESAGNV